MMKIIKKYSSWVLVGLFVGFAIIAIIFADSIFIKRINDVSTVLLALLTAAYVVFTYQILRTTRPQPHVYASLPSNDMDVHLSIKNIGSRPAYDVIVTFEPSLDILAPTKQFKGSAEPLLIQPFMPPESEVKNFITSTVHILSDKTAPKIFNVKIQYRDSEERSYSDKYKIDLGSYIYTNKFLDYDKTHYLKEISESLKKMFEY